MVDMSLQNILDLPMRENDSGAKTIRGYLKALLVQLWDEGEGFSGKRPFGNSGWEHELYDALVEHKVIEGQFTIDQDGYLDVHDFDVKSANRLVFELIEAL